MLPNVLAQYNHNKEGNYLCDMFYLSLSNNKNIFSFILFIHITLVIQLDIKEVHNL